MMERRRQGEAQNERQARERRRRTDGERSQKAILEAAAELATVEGLEGLSIGRLADHVGMSKSGLYAHFGSKQELQLATIETARTIFAREVYDPGLRGPSGIARIYGLCDAFLSHLERKVFPGGCFFAAVAAELGAYDGPVTQRIRDFYVDWVQTFSDLIQEALDRGELDSETDTAQLAFELDGLLLGANLSFVLFDDEQAGNRARRGISERLERARS